MKTVLFDVSFLAHRARYTTGELTHKGEPTGTIFGFFNELLSVAQDRRVLSNDCHFFFDSQHSFRKEQFSGYKAKRAASRSEADWAEITLMKAQVKLLRKEILPACGFPIYIQTGLESDDLIAMVCGGEGRETVIITSDGDLYQCIDLHVHWFDPARDIYLDVAGFQNKKRVAPADWHRVKAMAGCSSDDVPGIPGVGEKTAIDHIWGTLPIRHKRYIAITSDGGMKTIIRNTELVRLPHRKTKRFKLRPPAYKPAKFFAMCERLGFDSFLEPIRRRAWENFFAGNMSNERQATRKRNG